ncbi:MAG: hypothetical protein H7Y00_09735 [Fimbriimonadaceae bacterium]|nr:hypothetical protein [Chitinophagales bacterium]
MKKICLYCFLFLVCNIVFSQTAETKQQYLGVLTLTQKYQTDANWTEQDGKIVMDHFQRLQRLAKEGVIILAGRTQLESNDPDMMGLIIIAATTKEEAEKIMHEDPAVINKIMHAKVLPFDVAVQQELLTSPEDN